MNDLVSLMNERSIAALKITDFIGAEVIGLDLSKELDFETTYIIKQLLLEHLVLVIRNQPISLDRLEEVGSIWGNLMPHPAAKIAIPNHPSVLVVQSKTTHHRGGGLDWHSDLSCILKPPSVSVLQVVDTPPTGGDTLFINMYETYNSLHDSIKETIEHLFSIHSNSKSFHSAPGALSTLQPIVRIHPDTKRKCLYISTSFTESIVDMSNEKSQILLDMLNKHVLSRLDYRLCVKWQLNTITIWDNQCTIHKAIWDYAPYIRTGYRVTAVGDIPYGS